MENMEKVIAPVPGTFYRKPSPNEAPYVSEGNEVKSGDTLGLIEVMKNYYEITATKDGVLEKFDVKDESIVDAGQVVAVIREK